MGQVNTEQAVEIMETTAEIIANSRPEPVPVKKDHYGWLLTIAIAPVIIGVVIKKFWKR